MKYNMNTKINMTKTPLFPVYSHTNICRIRLYNVYIVYYKTTTNFTDLLDFDNCML